MAKVSSGKITAIKVGTATIKVTTANGKYATCKITVLPVKVTSIKLNKTSITLKKGKTYTLKATVAPSDASNKKLIWKSSNAKIATVNSIGTVKGIKKGMVYVSVTTVDGKKTAKCRVTVR